MPSSIVKAASQTLYLHEATSTNIFDDGGSTHVGSSSAPNFESALPVDSREGGLTKHQVNSTRRYSVESSRNKYCPSSQRDGGHSLQHQGSPGSPKEEYDIRVLHPFFPSSLSLYSHERASLPILPTNSPEQAIAKPYASTLYPAPMSPCRVVGSLGGGVVISPSSPQSRSPLKRNFLKPPSPRLRLRPPRFQPRHSVSTTPLSARTNRDTAQGKAETSPTPAATISGLQGYNGAGDAPGEGVIVKLDEIGVSQCPRCSSRSLYIPAPQAAAALGAVVYRAKLEHKIYFGELISCQRRSDTPTTEVVAAESLELVTDPLERTHRERKRWQQLLKTMFDHLATRGHPENNPPHAALKMWKTAQLDRESFLQVFPQLPGVVGERLFAAFDVNKNGVIDFEEFSNGLAILSSSNLNNKLKFIFNMYDLNGDGQLSRDEMSMMLYHIPSSFSFLSNGRSRNLDKETGNGTFRRRSSSSLSTSALAKMLRTSRVMGMRQETMAPSQKELSHEGTQDLAAVASVEDPSRIQRRQSSRRHSTTSSDRPLSLRSRFTPREMTHPLPLPYPGDRSAPAPSAVRSPTPPPPLPQLPQRSLSSPKKPPPPSPTVRPPSPPSKPMPPLNLAKVSASPFWANSKADEVSPHGIPPVRSPHTFNPSSPRSGGMTSRAAEPPSRASPRGARSPRGTGSPRAATSPQPILSPRIKLSPRGARVATSPRGTVFADLLGVDGPSPQALSPCTLSPRALSPRAASPRFPHSPQMPATCGSPSEKAVDPQLKAALTRLKLGVMAVSAPAVPTPGASPRSRTHREILANASPRQEASPRRFSLGSNSPNRKDAPADPLDLENMSRLLHGEKATEETVKEFEVVVDKLVDRAFQIYENPDIAPRRVDLMSFDKFCEAVMKFQELRLALEVFCQETIQPQSFMPVPPDVLSTSQGTSRTNVLRTIGAKKLAAKIGQGNEPNTTTNAAATTSQAFQIPMQNTERSCVSDIEDPRASAGRGERPSNKKGDPINDDEEIQNGFAVDCSNCGSQFFCRLHADDVRVIDTKGVATTEGVEDSRRILPNRETWETTTPRYMGPKSLPTMIAPLPPCIRAHGDYVDFCGWLEKDGRRTGISVRRFYLLRDRFLYYYRTVNDLTPLHAMLITGCHCDKMINDPHVTTQTPEFVEGRRGSWPKIELETPKRFTPRYGFEIRPHYRGGRRSLLYAKTPTERDLWIKHINKASGVTGAGFHDVYMLQEPLGKGKFATVYRAMNRATMERVAVKILRKPDVSRVDNSASGSVKKSWFFHRHRWGKRDPESEEENEASIREFQRTEVAVLRLLYHPNLIRLLDVFNTNQYLYLVMEWGPSGDLRRTIDIVRQLNAGLAKRREASGGTNKGGVTPGLTELWIPEWIVREIIIGVLQGLSYLHSSKRNVIHRDLKPDNVLIKILISQLKFTMKQCITGLPSISSNTFDLVPSHNGRTKPRSKTTPVSDMGRFQSHLLYDRELDEEDDTDRGNIEQRKTSPAPLIRGETPSNESLDTVDFYPNVDSNGLDLEGETHSSRRLTPASIGAVREQLRLAGLKNTDTIPNCFPNVLHPSQNPQGHIVGVAPNKATGSTTSPPIGSKFHRGPAALSATDLFNSPDEEVGAEDDRSRAGSGCGGQEREKGLPVTLCKSVLDSQSPKDSTLMLRLGTMNMRRDSEACARVAAETLNFWIFLHCLEWYDTPKIKERRKRRSLTLPATAPFAATADPSRAAPSEGPSPGIPGEEVVEDEFNENALIPPFLRNKDSHEILEQSLNVLKSTQTIQSMNALFSSSFVKDAIVPKITDFGLSKIVAPPSNQDVVSNITGLATYAEEALGTAAYAAPEVLAGRRYTTSADLWSLGVVTYQLLSGGFFPVFKEVLSQSRFSSGDASGTTALPTAEDSSNVRDGAGVSSLLGLSKRLRPNRRSHIKLVLLFQPEHAWGRVGPLGKEFVQKLLDIDPSTRLTARDALAEPWMSREFAFAS